MKGKKICVFSISLGSGGAEKVISLLLKKLVLDYEVTLVLLYDTIHFAVPDDVKVVILTKSSHKLFLPIPDKFKDGIVSMIGYLKIIKKNRFDVAISFLALPNFINSFAKMLNPRLKTIISERGYPSDNTSSLISKYISKLFYPLLYNRNNHLFSNSVYINEDLERNFNIKIPMSVIYNPIELPPIKSTPHNQYDHFRVVNVGTLNARKNQMLLLRTLSLKTNDFSLDIFGQGPDEEMLKTNIEKLKLSKKVTLQGKVENVQSHIGNYDCFVLSSNTEGFPNALLEAMAVGLPCISTNCLSGPLELLHHANASIKIEKGQFFKGDYGLLINNNDEIALFRALNFLRESASERIKYGKLALDKSRQFELNNIYPQLKRLIES